MGLLSAAGRLGKAAVKSPIVRKVGVGALKSVPFVGTAVTVASTAYDVYNAAKPKPVTVVGGQGLPALPGLPSLPQAGLPKLTGGPIMTAASVPATVGGVSVPATIGRKAVAQMPTDMATLKALENAGLILPFNALGVKHYAPRGFVVVSRNGVTIGVRRDVAIRNGWFKPAHKPVISVGESQAMKKAAHAVKKYKSYLHKSVAVVAHSIDKHGHIKHTKKKKG